LRTEKIVALVTGAASGLGKAAAEHLVHRGATVVLTDRDLSAGRLVASALGERAVFMPGDVTDTRAVAAALDTATELGPLRVLIHCAGGGRPVRVLSPTRHPSPLDDFQRIVELNLVGTYDVLRQATARMASNEPMDGDCGVCVLTSSIAAFEGQSAQVAYAASKAGIVGMTLPAARDLSRHKIRVCTIAPGIFDTGMLSGLADETREAMSAAVPHPARLGTAEEYALLAIHIVENGMLNGECIRLDGALRLTGVDTMWGTELQPPASR
jgi:NAD(P)-dependent dehydrogenase (short-subunit alcohol dehydrogenase family)